MRYITKSNNDRIFAGVCGGIAEYFHIDSTIVRIVAFLIVTTGAGLLPYILAALLMPGNEDMVY